MDLYIAVPRPGVLESYLSIYPDAEHKIIISYGRRNAAEASLLLQKRHLCKSIILDSGTWTLNQNPRKYEKLITFDGYKAYLEAFADRFDFYFNYDQEFKSEGFEINFDYQLQLEEAGFAPVPVIHDCYGPEVPYYINAGYKLISIGSGELKYASLDALKKIMEPFHRHGIKIHFLGCTDFVKLANLPVFSCDSSTWNQAGAKEGFVYFWNSELPWEDKTDKVFLTQTPEKRMIGQHYSDHRFLFQFEDYLEKELNLELGDLVGKGKEVLHKRAVANIHHFIKLEKLINKRHAELGFLF